MTTAKRWKAAFSPLKKWRRRWELITHHLHLFFAGTSEKGSLKKSVEMAVMFCINFEDKKMLLSYNELCELVEQGVITEVKPESINAASIDIHLGDEILSETYGDHRQQVIDLSVKPRQSVQRERHLITGSYYDMLPMSGILAHTVEKFYLPDDIVGEYYLNSSLARNHLEHLHAGHCDCGWSGSALTLELINLNRFHTLRLRPGQRIGQMLFYKVTEVPEDRSYRTIGNYNGDSGVGRVKG
jgi:dCTP deaminase